LETSTQQVDGELVELVECGRSICPKGGGQTAAADAGDDGDLVEDAPVVERAEAET
jgi:hypothetical protein